jgi:sarcosine oxidase subunit alpha
MTSVTDHWAATAIVGPRSREVLRRLAPTLDASAEAFPFLAMREAEVGGVPARVFRISFSGELAFEVNVPSWYGRALWDAVAAAGSDLGITPYGTEAMHVLRAEKGYVIVGQETDGTVTPLDLGLDWMISKRKWFIGSRSLRRPAMLAPDRRQLIGLLPLDHDLLLPEGAALPATANGAGSAGTAGHVTSSYHSATLGRTFALALLAGGRAKIGGEAVVALDGRDIRAQITAPVFYDPENQRRDG